MPARSWAEQCILDATPDGYITLLAHRILDKVRPEGECLLWEGAGAREGHGRITLNHNGKHTVYLVYRIIYAYHNNGMPENIDIRHTCTHLNCVNIEHLKPHSHIGNPM